MKKVLKCESEVECEKLFCKTNLKTKKVLKLKTNLIQNPWRHKNIIIN